MFLIPQELVDAFEQRVVRPVTFIYIDWPGGAVYAHTGVGTITYMGQVWYGLGSFADIGEVVCDNNIGSHTLDAALSGIDPKALKEVTTNDVINRDLEAHLGALGEDGRLISAAPYFYGRISSTNIKRYGNDSIAVQATSKTSDWIKNRSNRYTDESYRASYPNDDFFQYIKDLADRALYWNSDKESTPLVPRR